MFIKYILLFLSVMAGGVTFYYGFIEKNKENSLYYKIGFVGFVVFTVLLSFNLNSEGVKTYGLDSYIKPYANTKKAITAVQSISKAGKAWSFVTSDPAAKVFTFYADPKNHKGWKLGNSSEEFISFTRPGLALNIIISEQFDGTYLTYTLQYGRKIK